MEEYIKELKIVEVCESKDLLEGQRRVVTVKDHKDVERKIIIIRNQGKLYSFIGHCTYREPFDSGD